MILRVHFTSEAEVYQIEYKKISQYISAKHLVIERKKNNIKRTECIALCYRNLRDYNVELNNASFVKKKKCV